MDIFKNLPRRQVLLGAGAALIQSAIPVRLRALTFKKKRVPKPGGITPDSSNPFFHPVGPALNNKFSTPKVRKGLRVSSTSPPMTNYAESATPSSLTAAEAVTVASALAAAKATAEQEESSSTAARVLAASAAALALSASSTGPVQAATTPSTLVLYDTTGQWGWLGEMYAIMAANLASHFGSWTAMPVVSYTSGTIKNYSAVIYIGSTYGEPVPTIFLADVSTATTPVIWMYDNIWQLPGIVSHYGLNWMGFDYSSVAQVTYKSQQLKRYAANAAGIMNYWSVGSATVLATCVRSDGTTFPWAVRSGNLTYIGENPFSYISEGDRYLILCDLLFDALAPPTTATRHQAYFRLEDIDPTFNPTNLRTIANWLSTNHVPFGFTITPQYLDPLGYYNNGVPVNTPLHTQTALISAIKYMQSKGGTMILHGYTHQYSNVANPYTGVTGDDCEFYRITLNPDFSLNYRGPVSGDSTVWAQSRFTSAKAELILSGLTVPTIHTFPAYAGSAADSFVEAATFAVRSARVLYFSGLLSGRPIDYTRLAGQYFPYSVRDVYNGKVLADTLGGIQPTAFNTIPPRLPADIIADAQRNLVVRDGVASFFYNPEDSITYLQQTVQGIQALGYTFVSPASL
jgi:uncharacterized protein YdaL